MSKVIKQSKEAFVADKAKAAASKLLRVKFPN